MVNKNQTNIQNKEKVYFPTGKHLLVDLIDIDRNLCMDVEIWITSFERICKDFNLKIISKNHHIFEPPQQNGMTAFVLIDSSHFSVHTYADEQQVALDLFICREINIENVFNVLIDLLNINQNQIANKTEIARFIK